MKRIYGIICGNLSFQRGMKKVKRNTASKAILVLTTVGRKSNYFAQHFFGGCCPSVFRLKPNKIYSAW